MKEHTMPKHPIDVEMPKSVKGDAIAIPKGANLLTSTPYACLNDTFLVAERDITAAELRGLIEAAKNEEAFIAQAHTIGLAVVAPHLLVWAGQRDGVRFHQP